MSKAKRVTWWKMFAHQRAAVEAVSDKAAGAGLKAAFRYFDGEDIPPGSLTPQAFTVFCVIRPYIDEARQDYERSVENGKKGAAGRWGDNTEAKGPHSPPIAPLSPPIGCLREAEAEADLSIALTGNREIPPLPPKGGKRERFTPPTVDEVAAYCRERQNDIDPAEFVAFYASKGWKVGTSPMRDWRAAVITWERKRAKTAEPESAPAKRGRLVVGEDGEEVVVFDE